MRKNVELIEKYIDGELDPEAYAEVKRLISKDSEFAKEYQLQLELNEAIQEKEVMALRANLNKITKSQRSSHSGKVIQLFSRNWHVAAASISILLVVGSFLLTNLNSSNSDNLFETYYNGEQSVVFTRSSDGNFQTNLNLALRQYDLNEYDSAIQLLEEINDNLVADFYLGMAYVEVESYDKASESFERILNEGSTLFEEQAEWYNALCILKLGQRNEAISMFKTITEGNSLYKKDAAKILEALN